ncbi:MAG: serine/threonine protein kinase [Myxococcales bacterium]|nr:serine/threonine protein kinase [Myxococcales bacterium]
MDLDSRESRHYRWPRVTLHEGDLIHSRYRLLRLIGVGTSGSVWAAKNELIEREVALKVLDPEVTHDKVLLTRFFNEAKAIGRVKHQSIVGIYDLGQAEDGSPFLVLELLDGEPLASCLSREGPLEPETLCDLCCGVAGALDLAHQQGIVHRDLKPANIFMHRMQPSGLIGKILDFGISKILSSNTTNFALTKAGTVLGSPAYMSPEQAAGRDDLDGRADVWSLGVVMFEALTATLPHEAPNYNALMIRILTQDIPPIEKQRPELSPSITAIVNACLRRNRDERPTAGQLRTLLESATRTLRAERFAKSGGRRRDDSSAESERFSFTTKAQIARYVAVGAAAGLGAGGLLGLAIAYFMWQ